MKPTVIAFVVGGLLIGGALMFGKGSSQSDTSTVAGSNVSIVNGMQIIEIHAKGGYQPRKSTAKAGIPTILRFDTNGTFDCSSSVRIPSMNISQVLPQTGSTDVDIGSPQLATLQGICGMGMYPFEVDFES